MKAIVYVIQYRKDGKWVDFTQSGSHKEILAVQDTLDKLFHDQFKIVRRNRVSDISSNSINELNLKNYEKSIQFK